jgi:hypothetical protein
MRTRLAVPAVLLAGLALAAPAVAAPWSRVTTPDGTSADQVGLAYNTDASTSVAWTRRTSPTTQSLFVTRVTNSRPGPTSTVAADWATLANPAIVRGELTGQTRVFFGGRHSTDETDPYVEQNSAVSTDDGRTWALEAASTVAPGTLAYGSPMAATFNGAAGFQTAWASTLGLFTHTGIDQNVPVVPHPSAPSAYDPGLAPGSVLGLAWYSNDSAAPGVYAVRLDQGGGEQSAPMRMPGTDRMTFGMSARTPITLRDGGGVRQDHYVAYPTGTSLLNRIRVWKVGSSSAPVVGRSSVNSYATVTITPRGRLWVAWTDRIDGDAKVFARRSNPDVTKWGAIVEAGAPRGAQSAYAIDGMANESNELDAYTSFSIGESENTATYVTHVLPGLTLARLSGRLDDDEENTIRFKVTDAGDPVEGARVRIGGKRATTDEDGIAEIEVRGRGTKMKARATMERYVKAELELRVRD